MSQRALRCANFLALALHPTYLAIVKYLGEKLDLLADLSIGEDLQDFSRGELHLGFLCGLLYVRMKQVPDCPVELLAAPVLQGERYGHQPLYFSDVIVHSDSPYQTFDDLKGCTWAYNERASHSGYNLVCYSLKEQHKDKDYFGTMIATGSHQNSLQAVLEGEAQAAALDSHLLDVLRLQHPELEQKIRVIDMLGPSTIPPIVVAKKLDDGLKDRLQKALVTMHYDLRVAEELHKGCISHFVPIEDSHYNDIRHMLAVSEGSRQE